MTLLLHEVLRKVKAGAKSFCPQGDARGDLDKFQVIAKTVVYAYEQGYISRIIPRMESISGQTYYNLVLVDGGLTFEGEGFLDQLSGQPTPADEELDGLLNRIQSYNIRDRWEKALSRRVTDPSGAITAARSLLETTLKWIILERGGSLLRIIRSYSIGRLMPSELLSKDSRLRNPLKDLDRSYGA